MSNSRSGISIDRVVAVIATLRNGREQLGTGYLVAADRVLTAEHCTRDNLTGEPATGMRVVRAGDGSSANVADRVADDALDIAVLSIEPFPPSTELTPPMVAKVDQSRTGVLADCVAVGFPSFQRDPRSGARHTAELHGTIYQTDELETGHLLMREHAIRPGAASPPPTDPSAQGSPWGGLSGALVFHHGQAIGVVVEHHPRQGEDALRLIGFEQVAKHGGDVQTLLGLGDPDDLPQVRDGHWPALEPLLELWDADTRDLPKVESLNPYQLGATATALGDQANHGRADPYVARNRNAVDTRLRDLLQPGALVLLVGPSKAGKTRTAFEAVRESARSPTAGPLPTHARRPGRPSASGSHLRRPPRLAGRPPEVLATHQPLTPGLLRQLTDRPGPTMALCTLRSEERARLGTDGGELSRDSRRLLEDAREATVLLEPTSDDPTEQAAARAAYPDLDLTSAGLAEQLAGPPPGSRSPGRTILESVASCSTPDHD